jgi:uncharacterized protein YggE
MKPRTISVSGSAIGYIQPDAILWTVTRESTGKTLFAAKEANEQEIKLLLDACTKKGIQGSDVSLGMINIRDPSASQEGGSSETANKFIVTRNLTVRQKELPLFHDLLALFSNGNGKVKYSTYCSKTDKITRDTMLRATQAAKDKAATMTTALGATLGPVISLNEYPPVGSTIKDENVIVDESSAVVGADAQKLRITVYVVFELL